MRVAISMHFLLLVYRITLDILLLIDAVNSNYAIVLQFVVMQCVRLDRLDILGRSATYHRTHYQSQDKGYDYLQHILNCFPSHRFAYSTLASKQGHALAANSLCP